MIKNNNIVGWLAYEKQHEDEKSGYYAAIMFLVWPMLAIASAIWNYRSSWGKNILWAFVAFYGFSYAIGVENQNSDIVRYVAEVEYLYGIHMTPSDALEYYNQSGEVDILRTFLAIAVSRFTDSQTVLTLIYGIIFGFFFSRNIWYVLNRLEGKIRPITIILLVCLFLIIPFWFITTFRMWTAAHVFLYGLLPFLYEKQWKGVVIASCSVLVHFAFLIPVGILCLYILCGNRMRLYFIFFIATFFVAEINLAVFNNLVESYAPEMVQERTSGYRGEDYVETYREGTGEDLVWYAAWNARALRWVIVSFLILFFIKSRSFFEENRKWLRLFSFILFYFGIANLLSSLPSGGRYMAVANFLALTLIVLYVQNQEKKTAMQWLEYITMPCLLLFIVVSVRTGFYSISVTAILGNPVVAMFFNENHISLNDLLKSLL